MQNDESTVQDILADFTHDKDLFMDGQPFVAYEYSEEKANHYWQRQQDLQRIHLAVMMNMFKNKGYGTAAEQLALEYAFVQLNMNCVFADSLVKNLRSQHVLKKSWVYRNQAG